MTKEHHGETSDDWPDIVAVSPDRLHRIAISRDSFPATQWILQVRMPSTWRSAKYCQTREGLLLFAPPELRPVVEQLPERCPQRVDARRMPMLWTVFGNRPLAPWQPGPVPPRKPAYPEH